LYSKVYLYYFSGTGNAKHVTEWIGEQCKSSGTPVEIVKIEEGVKPLIEQTDEKKLIGFLSPTHGFNLPPIVLNFIFRFPRIKYSDVFIINTRAGMKLSKLFLPGLSGVAQLLAALVLFIKGFQIKGLQPIDLPSNWISLHPGLKQRVVDSMYERIKRKTGKFTTKILAGKRVYTGLISLPVDLAISPISAGYYLMGRFMLAKTFLATSKCTSCGLCVKQCPVKALKMKNDRPYWTYNCESCMRCMNNCPTRAIETPHGFITIVWIVIFTVPSFLFSLVLNKYAICSCSLTWYHKLGYNVASLAFMFLFVWFTYWLLYKFMRFRITDFIVKYSSFTYYKFWRRYKAPKKI
jgi:Pyruvate/2-oxoacid:ferredoxin oxidoreductase delta subunit